MRQSKRNSQDRVAKCDSTKSERLCPVVCCSGVEDLAARKSDWTFRPQIVGKLFLRTEILLAAPSANQRCGRLRKEARRHRRCSKIAAPSKRSKPRRRQNSRLAIARSFFFLTVVASICVLVATLQKLKSSFACRCWCRRSIQGSGRYYSIG